MKPLKFIHITKTGGTSIEKAGHAHGLLWGMNDKDPIKSIRKHSKIKSYSPWHNILTDKHLQRKYDWFMVVRNPYTRMLSEYYCKWGGIGDKNVHHTKEQMNQYLIDQIKNRNKYQDHYVEQYRYLFKGSYISVLKFENLESHFDKLTKQYDLGHIRLQKLNSAQDHNNELRFTVNDFSKELIELINKVYDKDFKYFGYTKIHHHK